jgi:hypothetical protein
MVRRYSLQYTVIHQRNQQSMLQYSRNGWRTDFGSQKKTGILNFLHQLLQYHRLVRVENHNTELFITNHLATVKKGLLVYYYPTGSYTARLDDIFILAPKPSIEHI